MIDKDVTNYNRYDVSARMREHGWIIPAYQFPANREDLHVLRIVVRNGFSRDLADMLLRHFDDALKQLERPPEPLIEPEGAFHH